MRTAISVKRSKNEQITGFDIESWLLFDEIPTQYSAFMIENKIQLSTD